MVKTRVHVIIHTGGYDGSNIRDEVLQFDLTSQTWTQVGTLEVARSAHAMTIINKKDIFEYSTSNNVIA